VRHLQSPMLCIYRHQVHVVLCSQRHVPPRCCGEACVHCLHGLLLVVVSLPGRTSGWLAGRCHCADSFAEVGFSHILSCRGRLFPHSKLQRCALGDLFDVVSASSMACNQACHMLESSAQAASGYSGAQWHTMCMAAGAGVVIRPGGTAVPCVLLPPGSYCQLSNAVQSVLS
jgi:hypothetical protein